MSPSEQQSMILGQVTAALSTNKPINWSQVQRSIRPTRWQCPQCQYELDFVSRACKIECYNCGYTESCEDIFK